MLLCVATLQLAFQFLIHHVAMALTHTNITFHSGVVGSHGRMDYYNTIQPFLQSSNTSSSVTDHIVIHCVCTCVTT